MAFVAIQSWPDAGALSQGDIRWLAVLRGVAVAGVLAIFWRGYVELHRAPVATGAQWLTAFVTGVAVFVAWIVFDDGVFAFETGPGFRPLRPDGSIDPVLAGLRFASLVVVVPVMEELFWRSFLLRWLHRKEFLSVDPRTVPGWCMLVCSVLFALEHSQWFAGLLAGLAYGWLYLRTNNLWLPILSHGTTNALLGTWILATGQWKFW